MSGTTSPTAPYLDATGIHAPTFEQILTYLQSAYQAIYGYDVYLAPDSQDGQLLSVFASAINDANSAAIAVYNAFSPATAQGVGLSSVVKINGIARATPSNSTVSLLITGTPGTTISNGYALDVNNNQWALPATVIVPTSGQITVQATAATIGSLSAPAGTITILGTPTRGWQSVINPSDAVPGNPVETDAHLRIRQASSTMIPSITATEGVVGAVEALPGVTRLRLYENDTSATDTNGVPSHSIALVVEGGDPLAIAQAIFAKKTPGCGTFGTTSETVVDTFGVPNTIRFFLPINVPVTVQITLTPLQGYTSSIGQDVTQAVVDYINGLPIGTMVVLSKLYVPANLTGGDAATFNINSILISRGSAAAATSNVNIAFNEAASASTSTVTVSVG